MLAGITALGLELLVRLDKSVRATHRKQLSHLGWERLRTLGELLRVSRSQVT